MSSDENLVAIEAIFNKRCGLGESHDRFFEWCYKNHTEPLSDVLCDKISGESGVCKANVALDNTTLIIDTECDLGAGKLVYKKHQSTLSQEKYDKVISFCRQEMLGPDSAIPWYWLLLLIIVLMIIVGGAFFLFWKYWLRKRVMGKQPGEEVSTIESHWTNSPMSMTSSMPQQGKSTVPLALRPSGSRNYGGPSQAVSGAGASRPVSGSGVVSSRQNSGTIPPSASNAAGGSTMPNRLSSRPSRQVQTDLGPRLVSRSQAPLSSREKSRSKSRSSGKQY